MRFSWAAAGIYVLAILAALTGPFSVAFGQAPNNPAFYTQKVRPILLKNCQKCHFLMVHKGGFAMDTKHLMFKGGRSGAAIVPGSPENSLLIKLIRHEGPRADPRPMPPKAPRMSDSDIAVIQQWIKAGAVMPDDPHR